MQIQELNTKQHPNICLALDFVSKAMGTDIIKPYLMGIYIDYPNHTIVATDSRREHLVEFIGDMKTEFKEYFKWVKKFEYRIFEIKKVKDGYYFISEREGTFPNYKRVIPDYKQAPYENIESIKTPMLTNLVGIFISKMVYYTKRLINADYIKDLLPVTWKKNTIEWSIFVQNISSIENNDLCAPVIFESSTENVMTFIAIIMPVQTKKDIQ